MQYVSVTEESMGGERERERGRARGGKEGRKRYGIVINI